MTVHVLLVAEVVGRGERWSVQGVYAERDDAHFYGVEHAHHRPDRRYRVEAHPLTPQQPACPTCEGKSPGVCSNAAHYQPAQQPAKDEPCYLCNGRGGKYGRACANCGE